MDTDERGEEKREREKGLVCSSRRFASAASPASSILRPPFLAPFSLLRLRALCASVAGFFFFASFRVFRGQILTNGRAADQR